MSGIERPPRGPGARAAAAIDPIATEPKILQFLLDLFPEEGGGFPQSVDVRNCTGPIGEKLGLPIYTHPFKSTGAKPTREELVELSNKFLQKAQDNCDGLNYPASRYAFCAVDLLRSQEPYNKLVIMLRPSGTVLGAGNLFDEEGAMSAKFAVALLNEERRDKRWMMEQSWELTSGVTTQMREMLESQQKILQDFAERQIKLISATEAALDQGFIRKEQAAWNERKREYIDQGFKLLQNYVVPAVVGLLTEGKGNVIPQMLKDFLATFSKDQGEKIFGAEGENGEHKGGLLDEEQCKFFAAIVSGGVEPVRILEFVAGLRPEQLMGIQETLRPEQLAMLQTIGKVATKAAEKKAAAEKSATETSP